VNLGPTDKRCGVGGPAETLKQDRRSHRSNRRRHQEIARHAAIRTETVADRDIRFARRQIGKRCRRDDPQIEVGMTRVKITEPRHQPAFGEKRRDADRQQSAMRVAAHALGRIGNQPERVSHRRQ